MPSEMQRLFQGRDWTTARFSVAEAFDTLDRLNDLCVCKSVPDDDEGEETEAVAFYRALFGLVEGLTAQLKLVAADTIPSAAPAGPFEQAWAAVEIDRALQDLKNKLHALASGQPSNSADSALFVIFRLKTGLKKLDQ